MLDKGLAPFFPCKPQKNNHVDIVYKKDVSDELISYLITSLESHMEKVAAIGIRKIMVGLSGGIDSAIVCSLLKKANLKAFTLIIELDDLTELSDDTMYSVALAKKIGIQYKIVNATRVYQEHLKLIESNSVLARVHLRSRLINSIVFQFADNESAIVVDTTDKSEDILKIYEESFRGHIAPLIDLYKSELYDIADYFSLSELRERNSGCPELIDIDAFGISWDDLDPILHTIVNNINTIEGIAQKYNLDLGWLQELQARIKTQPLRTTVQQVHI